MIALRMMLNLLRAMMGHILLVIGLGLLLYIGAVYNAFLAFMLFAASIFLNLLKISLAESNIKNLMRPSAEQSASYVLHKYVEDVGDMIRLNMYGFKKISNNLWVTDRFKKLGALRYNHTMISVLSDGVQILVMVTDDASEFAFLNLRDMNPEIKDKVIGIVNSSK